MSVYPVVDPFVRLSDDESSTIWIQKQVRDQIARTNLMSEHFPTCCYQIVPTQDRRLCNTILGDFYSPQMLDPKFKLSPSGLYYAPPKGCYEDYLEFIKVPYPVSYSKEIPYYA